MGDGNSEGLAPRQSLSAEERAEIAALTATCNAAEGLDLKLSVGSPFVTEGETGDYLYNVDGVLAGYCSVSGGGTMPVEVCGMVHPRQRRRGVGHALLAAAREECRRRGKDHLLLLCEEASASGLAFVKGLGAEYRFSEHRLDLDLKNLPPMPPGEERLALRRVGAEAAPAFIRVLAAAFGDPAEVHRPLVMNEIGDPEQWFYLAYLDGEPIATLKVSFWQEEAGTEPRAGIYAFGVLPAYQGRGYGRRVLRGVIDALLAQGHTRLSMEVETANEGALGLYLSCGFRKTTTYGYYRVMV